MHCIKILILYLVHVYMCDMRGHAHVSGGHLEIQFSPSIIWVLEIKFRLSGLVASTFSLPSPLISPSIILC